MYENILPLEKVDNHENPKITYHFTNPEKGYEWWICAGEKLGDDDYYFFGVGKIIDKEMGFMTLKQIIKYGGVLDEDWNEDMGLQDVMMLR